MRTPAGLQSGLHLPPTHPYRRRALGKFRLTGDVSVVVEHSTDDPKYKGSDPTAAVNGRK